MAEAPVVERPHRVLLIDDQPIIAEAVRRILAPHADLSFHYCSDASEALDVAVELEPTVVLQDLVMPGIDGLELVQRFRANAATRDVPLIVLSMTEEPLVKAEAFRRGANDYLVKLPSADELLARVRYHSQAYQNARQRQLAYDALLASQEQLRERNAETQRQRDQLSRQARDLEVRNQFIRKTFGRYISDDVVAGILDSDEGSTLGGDTRVVSILMSDLRGFTAAVEKLSPQEVMALLNNYLGTMADVIAAHRGTVIEFVGDAILALFGAPLGGTDDARRAMSCAIAMQLAMAGVNETNARGGLPAVEMGVAVHTGPVIVGHIGSMIRAKYAVVGANVNYTARIEALTVGGQVLVSDAAREAGGAGEVRVGPAVTFQAKGIAAPITAYELRAIEGAWAAVMPVGYEPPMRDLVRALGVSWAPIDGKTVGTEDHRGAIVRASARRAEVLTLREAALFVNIVLRVGALEVYAKVTALRPGGAGFSAHFTAVPDGFVAQLAALWTGD